MSVVIHSRRLYTALALSVSTLMSLPGAQAETSIRPPAQSHKDWLKLKSNELLRGEIKTLYDDKLEFDSDELDTVMIDWEDVKLLQSAGTVSIGFTDLSTRSGKLLVEDGRSYLDGVEFDPGQIMTIIAGEQSEANYWSAKISLGANIRSGNTDQIDYSARAKTTRRTTESRFNADYLGNYTKSDGTSTVNNHRVNSNFDWFISKQFYVRPVFAELYKDPFLNIDYKATLGAGLGYNIIDSKKTEWSISGGPAYTYTRFDQVETGAKPHDGSASVVLETVFDTELSGDVDFTTKYQLQYSSEDSGGYSHHAIASLSVDLTDIFDLDLSVVWDHTGNPQAGSNGIMPDKNDYQFIIGFGIDL
ncbi:DUF481 domain-containing protein [Shewanella sp. GXUN23E]|uniref:DUF481 domain-containing protein n=1 Tax=Shewanella sp. GXUN23E TaxID=3422498 RepID=UPI003D7D0CB7